MEGNTQYTHSKEEAPVEVEQQLSGFSWRRLTAGDHLFDWFPPFYYYASLRTILFFFFRLISIFIF